MLLSLSWLREFTPYEGTAEELGDRLTMLGLELEDIRHPYEHLRPIVVGHVVSCEAHPQSDHLHVCRVDVGQEEVLDIVCGAPNVASGQKVPVALVGTSLPDGTVIKKAKLRGAPSYGMICSERELGLSEDHNGIMILPGESAVGASLVDILHLESEVLDISVTPNRADCLSVLGLARETALAFDLPLRIPDLPLQEDAGSLPRDVPLEIQAPENCWLYAGRVIEGIGVGPSPLHLRQRLQAVGVRAISNIVDVTNYTLFECGQPLHAFDMGTLAGGRIVVRQAREGERFTTLDGQERTLNAGDLCICDAQGPVALAGVMGGLATEITSGSTTVFLESAVFRPALIRKTSRRLGLSSESSYRFERGIDQQRSLWALDRACAMMVRLGGGRVLPGRACSEPRPFSPARISFRLGRVKALLGVEVPAAFTEKVLTGLGCGVERPTQNGETHDETWQVLQPSWRPDLTREVDLIEEVGRFHGLDTIEAILPPVLGALERAGEPASAFDFWLRIRHWGAGLGLNEAIDYSFTGQKDLDSLGLPREGRVVIKNPLSSEQDVLRTALAPGLLYAMRNNLSQGAQGVRLFELARVFTADSASETTVRERGMLGLLLHGVRYDAAWPRTEENFDYADLKGIVEHLCRFLHVGVPDCALVEEHPYLCPCVSLTLGGRELGHMGRVKPAVADAYLARKDVWLAELSLEELRALHDATPTSFTALPAYPPVRRDITVVAQAGLTVGEILAEVRRMRLPLLEDVALVDCFEPPVEPGVPYTRHLTFRLTFRHGGRTLKDAEVDKLRGHVAESLVKALPVHI